MSPSRGAIRRAEQQRLHERRIRLRRSALTVIVVLAVAAVVVPVVHLLTAPPGVPAPTVHAVDYYIRYDVTTSIRGVVQHSVEQVWVDRPFRARDETTDANGKQLTLAVVTPEHYYLSTANGVLDLGTPRPQPPLGDYHLDDVITAMVRQHLAIARGTRTVVGRACTIYRTGKPLGDPFAAPTQDEYDDICLDSDGLVLAEDWWLSGSHIRSRLATAVSTARVPDSQFTVADAKPIDPSLAPDQVQRFSTKQLPKDTADFWLAKNPPWGFRLHSRYRAARSTAEGGGSTAVTLDVYQHGAAYFIVQQQPAPSQATTGRVVTVKGVGTGRITETPTGPRLDVTARGVAMTIFGTATDRQMLHFAERLRPVHT